MHFTGGCACGNVRYQADVDEPARVVCHCLDCQVRTSSAYSVNLIMPKAGLKITKGTTKIHSRMADSGKPYHVHFCADCGVTLYGDPEAAPEMVSIKAGSLDDPQTHLGKIQAEAYTKRRRDYLKPMEGAEQVEGMVSV